MADVNVKTIETRLQLKYDTYANWTDDSKAGVGANLVLLKGEIGIVEIEAKRASDPTVQTPAPTVLFKVGDGEHKFSELNWASALAADVYAWAKAETVEFNSASKKVEFKTGDTVIHDVDLSFFASASDVTDHGTRLADIEAALGLEGGEGSGSVSAQLASIVQRLGVIQGADTVEGSIAKAEKDAIEAAKAYTDEVAGNYTEGVEGEDGYKAASGLRKEIAEAQAAAVTSANAYTDGEVATLSAEDSRLAGEITRVEGLVTAEATNRENGDKAITDLIGTGFEATETGTVAAKVKAAQDAADAAQADVDALTAADGLVTKNAADIAELQAAIEALNGDEGTLAEINAAIEGEADAREAADQAILDKIGAVTEGKTVAEMIAQAQTDAEANAATTAQGKVDALANGTVAENTAAIAANKTAIETEASRAQGVEEGLAARIKAVEDDYLTSTDKEALQTQINTIMNNPDAEGAINSINEFTQYVAEHGEVAEGFRAAIAENKQAIIDNATLAAQTYETKEDATAKYDELAAIVNTQAVQADWSVNDPEDPAYIKNRPFYVEAAEVAFIDEITFEPSELDAQEVDGAVKYWTPEFTANEVADGNIWLDENTPMDGALFTVIHNGVTYNNVPYVRVYSQFGYIGVEDSGTSQAYPFSLRSQGEDRWAANFATQERHTIMVTRVSEFGNVVQLYEGYIPDTIARVSDVEGVIATVEAAVSANEANITSLQDLTAGDWTGTIKDAVDAAAALAQTGIDNAATAQAAAEAAQDEVDALEGVVSTLRGEYDVTKALATSNEAAISALDTRVGTAEGAITDLQAIVSTGDDSNAKLREAIEALEAIVVDGDDSNTALGAEIDAIAAKVNDEDKGLEAAYEAATDAQSRVAAIEADYLKSTDVFVFNCGSSSTVTHTAPVTQE